MGLFLIFVVDIGIFFIIFMQVISFIYLFL